MIRIDNKTHWRTDDVRKLIRRAIVANGQDPKAAWQVEVYYTRRANNAMGYAWYGSTCFRLGLPRAITTGRKQVGQWMSRSIFEDVDELPADIVRRAAQVTIHELDHCRGLRHKDMPPSRSLLVDWADGLRIRKRGATAPAPEPSEDERAAAECARAQAAVDRVDELIEAEQKRHRTQMKRLRTRRRKAKAALRYRAQKAEKIAACPAE